MIFPEPSQELDLMCGSARNSSSAGG